MKNKSKQNAIFAHLKNKESAITLIALIISVIVLIIISAIVVNGITGDEGIISSAKIAKENYIVAQYEEKLEQAIQNIELKHAILGQDVSLSEIAEELRQQEDWIDSIEVNTETGDITVITKDGYTIEVHYDQTSVNTGGDTSNLPIVTATYEEASQRIDISITNATGELSLKLICKEEIIDSKTIEVSGEVTTTFTLAHPETSWYKIKVTNEDGKSVSAWVKVVNNIRYYALTVKHYLENANDTNYTLYDTAIEEIAVNTTVTLAEKVTTVINGTYDYGSETESTSGASSSKVNEITMEAENKEISLYYKRNTYTLSLSKNSYVSSVSGNGQYKIGQTVSISATLGSATGYTYSWVNWTSSDTSLLVAPTGQSTTITMPAGAVTLTANGARTANTYTITLNQQSGSGGTGSVIATYGSSMPSITKPLRTGYEFEGYYTGTGGTGIQYYTSTGASARNWDKTGATTLYANWTANTYTVTLNQQSGSGGTGSVIATYGSSMPSITKPSRTGYTFQGYYTGTGGTGTQYYTSTGASARNWDKTTATTLYAKWIAQGMTVAQLASKIGYYVDYQSVIDAQAAKTIYSSGTYNGNDASLSWTRQNLTWRILDVDTTTNKVKLIAQAPDTQNLTLKGYTGYNNAVGILNKICAQCYSSSTLNVTARSINIEDIENCGSTNKPSKITSPSYTTSMRYASYAPAILQYETYQWPLSGTGTTHYLERSKQYSGGGTSGVGDRIAESNWFANNDSAGRISISSGYKFGRTWDNYSLLSFDNTATSPYRAIFSNDTKFTTTANNPTTYWLASRCVNCNSSDALFGVFFVNSFSLSADYLCYSDGFTGSRAYAVRPVVEIPLTSISIGLSGAGTISNPYSIAKK